MTGGIGQVKKAVPDMTVPASGPSYEARPIPETDDFFENVWREFRENGNIF